MSQTAALSVLRDMQRRKAAGEARDDAKTRGHQDYAAAIKTWPEIEKDWGDIGPVRIRNGRIVD